MTKWRLIECYDYKNLPMGTDKIDSSPFVNETIVANIEIYFQVT